MSAMRIVHYLSSMDLSDGGVVRAVLDLCPAMVAAGHQVTLLTCNDADVPPEWKDAAPWSGAGVPACVSLPPPSLPGGLLGRGAMERVREVASQAEIGRAHV